MEYQATKTKCQRDISLGEGNAGVKGREGRRGCVAPPAVPATAWQRAVLLSTLPSDLSLPEIRILSSYCMKLKENIIIGLQKTHHMLQRMNDQGGLVDWINCTSQVFAMQNQRIYADNSAFCCTWII